MKTVLFFVLALVILTLSLGDTKVLQNVQIVGDDSYRTETFSLKNENTPAEELVIEGEHTLNILSALDPKRVYKIETIYVADKDGYRVKYKLVLEDYQPIVLHLSPQTLKSLG